MRKTKVMEKPTAWQNRQSLQDNHPRANMFRAKSSLPSKKFGNRPAVAPVTPHDLSHGKAELGTTVTVSPATQQPLLPTTADASQKILARKPEP